MKVEWGQSNEITKIQKEQWLKTLKININEGQMRLAKSYH